ncbi:MAG: 4-hydroxyphenylacetate 3-hydroxylase family protein [Candidatus Bathyarchaeota archaeon]|jgi:4-hydroxyphenylacetate 3-monooxygenase/4-hydroxybutyryl-CoA dehydratase/vinylacetyl-CoA-Delta-isomerase
MRTSETYVESLRQMRENVYMNGKIVKRDDPELLPSIRVLAKTFDLINDPKFKDLITATSHLTGDRINRFTHINRNPDDLRTKQKMIRQACHLTGGCIQRCMGCDAINALSFTTHEVDKAFNTEYHKKFLKYLENFQRNDLVAAAAQTDVKGNRSLRPHQQKDPDLYVHVIERRDDGIIVKGAKNHITMAAVADEIICLPTRAMMEEDANYAVAFAVPADSKGVKLITHVANPRPRETFKAPISNYGFADSFVVFDDLFVPSERVFMCGEWPLAVLLAHGFALFHRHSYTGCKPAITDIVTGASTLVAEYQGIAGKHHVKSKLAHLASIAELVYAAGVASAVEGEQHDSGTFIPNTVYANVGRRHAGMNIYHEYETLVDLAGGLPSTLPFEGDFSSPETKEYLEKYIMRKEDVLPEDIHLCFRLLSDMLCSSLSGVSAIAGVHGGGSPVMEEIAINATYDFEEKKKIAEYLGGIKKN